MHRLVPDTLGRLKARYGVYYIFGNHDLRIDNRRLQKVLDDCGLIYLGGRWKVIEVRGRPGAPGTRVLVAGNELPWFKPAADLGTCPPRSEVPFRLLLSHSPDQLPGRGGATATCCWPATTMADRSVCR